MITISDTAVQFVRENHASKDFEARAARLPIATWREVIDILSVRVYDDAPRSPRAVRKLSIVER